MSFNIGDNFRQRWLDTPEAVRHTFCEELEHICQLLEPETTFHKWQHQEVLLHQKHRKVIEHAYETLKQEILAEQARLAEERRKKRQAELEEKVAQQRALEQTRLELLEIEEQQRLAQEQQHLQDMAQDLEQQLRVQSAQEIARFEASQSKQFNRQKLSLDEVRLRLEIESEQMIDDMLVKLKSQLKIAAKEEIDLLLRQQLSQRIEHIDENLN